MLYPDEKHNQQPQNKNSENIFLTGDNLEALKHLQNCYRGKVKMIYIDPPYNTGSDGFAYNDKFQWNNEQLEELLGFGEKEVKRLKSLEGRCSHAAWLTFIYPRLCLAQTLLRDDGVIFISIDDNEQANLKLICDEIFGEANFLADIIWQKKYAATNDSKGFSTLHDYILVYAKSSLFSRKLLPRTEAQNKPYKYDDENGRGLWRSDNLLVKTYSSSAVFPVRNPNTGQSFLPPEGSSWRCSKDTFAQWVKEGRIYFGKDGKGAPQLKRYLNEVQQGRVPTTWWTFDEVGHNDAANKELQNLFGSKALFDTPKPTTLIEQMLRIASEEDAEDIILDFFAGSGTTAQAVMELNKQDGGNRRWILCQLDEETKSDSEARKAGYQTIDAIARARIERAAEKIGDRSGYKSFYAKEPQAQTINRIEAFDPQKNLLIAENMMAEFADASTGASGEQVILTTWLAADNYPLTYQPEILDFAGYKAAYAGDQTLYLTAPGWHKEQTEALLNRIATEPLNVSNIIIFPYSFTLEALRELEINLKTNSPSSRPVSLEWRY